VNDAQVAAEAERVLASVPAYVWDGERLPVPVEDIADTCFGLLIRDIEDMTTAPGAPELAEGQALSGLLFAARGEIWVNADEARQWPPRRRFTIGHELGHWVMHRTPGQQSLFCRRTSVDETAPHPDPGRDIEEEASVFAAELLMPRWLVVREHARVGGDLEALCQTFRSSNAAMQRRVEALFS
jgi:hypothetical protein